MSIKMLTVKNLTPSCGLCLLKLFILLQIITIANCFKDLKKHVREINSKQEIRNLEKFGPITNETLVFIIQCHSRANYLKEVIKSISLNPGANDTLLIFSHDLYRPKMNQFIQNIRFTRVMQIYYPDAKDYISNKVYRPQMKHHWWWKNNFVFSHIEVLKDFQGLVTNIPDDMYIAPDGLLVLKKMYGLMTRNECEGCNLLNIGIHFVPKWNVNKTLGPTKNTTNQNILALKTSSWRLKNNIMSFNRSFWENTIRKCDHEFCTTKTYHWGISMERLAKRCRTKFLVLHPINTRIFHIGICGVHFQSKSCKVNKLIKTFKLQFEINHNQICSNETVPFILSDESRTKAILQYRSLRGGNWKRMDEIICKLYTKI